MARYNDSVCRLCRREGLKLFLKGERCYTEKCAIERREYGPGQHGQGRKTKASEYAVMLREKQKVRQLYGVLERQFRKTFHKAERMKGVTGENLIQLLETRLDNVIYRLGFASSRAEARLLVRQSHFLRNNKKVDIPSMNISQGDVITVKEKSKNMTRIQGALQAAVQRGSVPEWLEVNQEKMEGVVRALPTRAQVTMPINESMIIEYYSK